MGADIVINGVKYAGGITYEEMEVVTLYLGKGVDNLTVQNTSSAIHFVDLGDGNDVVYVKDISGPFLIHGKNGSDKVIVSSDEYKLENISALLGFDGGDGESDELILNNTGDTDTDDVLNVTRFVVEVPSMQLGESSTRVPSVSYLLNFRRATGGSFTLGVVDPLQSSLEPKTLALAYPVGGNKYESATLIEAAIQRMVIPKDKELDSCGYAATSKCSNAVKVWPVADDAFAVFFLGERLGVDMELTLKTDNLTGFDEEMFLNVTKDIINATNDIIKQNSDVCYSNLELLTINMGDVADTVVNVRGTSNDYG